jgi:hypothetical protein
VCQFLPPELPKQTALRQVSLFTVRQREARPQSNRSFGEKNNQVITASNTQMVTMTTAIISFSDVSSNRRIAPEIRPPKP